jgi:class 3 adenylate cyclase/tetratricopeptide (TPR) repeat protein
VSGEPAPLGLFEPYLPAVASHPAVSRGEPLSCDAVTLFLDIAGFTGLSERLARQGTAGTEQLGELVRQVIGGALDIAVGYGGDALAFGGDAVTVAFAGGESGWDRAQRCADGVIALVASGPAEITVRVGISGGRVTSLVAPGQSRHVMVHLGPGLDRAVAAAGRAERGEAEVARQRLGESAPLDPGPMPEWAPRVLHPVLASRVARAAPAPDEHRRVTTVFLSLPDTDDRAAAALGELSRFVSSAADVLAAAGGDILQCTGGDKGIVLFAVFGAPVAHPDDAARAVHAIERLRTDTAVPFAAGVATGLAFAASFGGRSRRFVSALGDTTNRAARLMASAAAGSTLIDESTLDAVGGRVRVGGLQQLQVKNRQEAVTVATVAGIDTPQHTFETDGDTPMVGRADELAAVERLFDGVGRALHLVGEAGSGKSRLAAEIVRRADVRDLAVRAARFEAFGTGQPLAPFAGFVRDRPGCDRIDSAEALAVAIDDVRPGDRPLMPLVAPLVGVPAAETAATAQLSEEERSELGRKLVCDLICACATPTLLLLEDLHWADEPSLRLLSDLMPRLAGTPMLLVTTRRPGKLALGLPGLAVGDMTAEQLASIVRDTWARLGGAELPQEYVDQLLARAGGSPLFAQTVTEVVRRGYRPGVPLPQPPMPDALLPFVTARLDALGDSVQTTALRAAVIGRPTSSRELAHVFGCEVSGVAADVALLAEAGIAQSAGGSESLMQLRHPAVAGALLTRASHADRAPLHELVCRYLVETDAPASEIARQLEHCDLPDLERLWYRAARQEAESRWALGDARHWAELALRSAAPGAAGADALALAELEQQLGEHAAAAARLAGLEGPDVERLLGRIAFETGDPVAAVEHLERAERDGARGPAVSWPLTMALCELGRFDDARERAEAQLAREEGGRQMRLDALANLGVVEFRQGDMSRASQVLEEAREIAAEVGDVLRLAHVTGDLAGTRFQTGRMAEALSLLDEAAALAERLGARRLVAMVLGNVTHLRLAGGDLDGAVRAAVASAEAALAFGDVAIALDRLQIPPVVAELEGNFGGAARWWRLHATLEERLGRPQDAAVSWLRCATTAAAEGGTEQARQAIARAESAAGDAETPETAEHLSRARDAVAGRYRPPPEAETAAIDLPPLDANLPPVTPEVVDELFETIGRRLDAAA